MWKRCSSASQLIFKFSPIRRFSADKNCGKGKNLPNDCGSQKLNGKMDILQTYVS